MPARGKLQVDQQGWFVAHQHCAVHSAAGQAFESLLGSRVPESAALLCASLLFWFPIPSSDSASSEPAPPSPPRPPLPLITLRPLISSSPNPSPPPSSLSSSRCTTQSPATTTLHCLSSALSDHTPSYQHLVTRNQCTLTTRKRPCWMPFSHTRYFQVIMA